MPPKKLFLNFAVQKLLFPLQKFHKGLERVKDQRKANDV